MGAVETSPGWKEGTALDERRERFERLYEEAGRRVLAYALRRTDPEEARDVVAEAFTVAWRRLEDVPEGDVSLPWLLVTARRILANRRRAAVTRLRAARTEPWPRAVVPDHADGVAAAASISDAFNRLAAPDRETLALVAWDGLEPREAARVAGCSAATFAVRLHRARRRLAALLEEPTEELA
jgi:RNA polymerase sigma-70 factor (ECF subfamily)